MTSSTSNSGRSQGDVARPESADSRPTGSDSGKYHRYPFYSPRFWHGMRIGTWFGLLAENRFRIHPTRWPLAIGVTGAGPFNEGLWLLQQCLFGRKLARTELKEPPLFILGHWRSGTTLLHELIAKDPRWGSPSTYQCFAPHHFLVSEWFFRTFGKWLLPSKRPMDNMEAGWDRPQEDEFALMNLGAPSPYRRIAFPNHAAPDLHSLDWDGLTNEEESKWVACLQKFLRAITYRTDKPLVLKSPTHTGRVGILAKTFPNAKFIHITRDPRSLYPSTRRLWQGLDQVQGLQIPRGEQLDEYVIDCMRRMYAGFHRDVESLAPEQIVHVRYEDLIADPVAKLEEIYDSLQLGDFADIQPTLQDWADSQHREYKTNQHQLTPESETRIRNEWSEYFERYGYA